MNELALLLLDWKLYLTELLLFFLCSKFAVWEVLREEEFAPLKNGDSAASDNPSACRRAIYSLHKKYLQNAGAHLKESLEDFVCEISPLLSYEGEDLRDLVQDKQFESSVILDTNTNI